MTSEQFKQAANIALNHPEIDLENEDTHDFNGYGVSWFQVIKCTIREVAALIRYQCVYLPQFREFMNIEEELKVLAAVSKTKFQIGE